MKLIKANIIASTLLGVSGLVLTSCDEVKPEDRYILGEEITAERAVLLEDFTGQMCLNCPEAHEEIEQLEQQFGKDKVIAVSIHCGVFGLSTDITNFPKKSVGLMTAEGNAILESYGISSFPMGVINMGKPQTYDLWATAVREALQQSTDVDIDVVAKYEADSKDGEDGYFGTINVKSQIVSGSEHHGNIQFWIVEDGIIAIQRQPDGKFIQDYTHNNVFRAQIFDGIRGKSANFAANTTTDIEGNIATRWTDKERWEINNLSVVAFVSDASGVLQVKKVKVQ